jgi:T5SS/PEP-CTERM-associated repeat protein
MTRLLRWLLSLACVACIRVSAESFTTNVIDGVATNIPGLFILGDTGPHNFLMVTNAGLLTTERTTVGNANEAHSNAAIVTGAGSRWYHTNALWFGLHSASNRLLVLEGGDVTAESAIGVGSSATAVGNLVHIHGAASSVTSAFFYLGTYGAQNQLLIEDGGLARVGSLIFNSEGNPNGGQQLAVVRGIGAQLVTTNLLQIGNSPSNTLSVREGGRLVGRNTTIGQGATSRGNRVEVSGMGTFWFNSVDVTMGAFGSSNNTVAVVDGAEARATRVFLGQSTSENAFEVASGAWVNAGQITVGDQGAAGNNRLRVIGPGTTLSNSAGLTIGNYGVGNSFVLSNGAFAQSRSSSIGMQYTANNNSARVTGTGTVWVAGQLVAGSAGRYNQLEIANGAQLFAGSLLSGGQGGIGNTTRVHGAASLLSVTNSLDLSGGNTLVVSNLARVESGSGVVGSYGPSNIALLAHGTWSNAGSLNIGSQSGGNRLMASEVGRLYCSNAVIGGSDVADFNRVEIVGKGTFWRIQNDLTFGGWGDSNELTIANGASLSARNLDVGRSILSPVPPAIYPGDANLLLIHGTNTEVHVSSNISLGYYGAGNRIEVRAGATLTSDRTEAGSYAISARNGIVVTDPQTLWHTTNLFRLGSNGHSSTLVVSNGARLRTGDAVLGDGGGWLQVTNQCSNQFGFNHAVITGTNTVWEVGRQLIVGRVSSSNTVTVTRGATLRAHELNVGRYGFCGPSDVNTFILDGGMLVVSNRLFNAPQGYIRMWSGRAEVNAIFVEGGPPGRVKFLGGLLRPGSLYASAPAEIEIGDRARRATLELTGGNYF